MRVLDWIASLVPDRSDGATAAEWVLMVVLIGIAVIAAATLLGVGVRDLFASFPEL